MLSRLQLDYWYKVLVVVGAAGALAAMTVELKGIENARALQLFGGLFFFGLGEWINHPLQTKLVRPNLHMPSGGHLTSYPHSVSLAGILFDMIGAILIAIAIYQIAKSA